MSCYIGPILTPHPLSHFVTHLGTPKVRHTSRIPKFLVVHAYIHISLQRVFFSSWRSLTKGFCPGFLSGWFCSGWFLSVPLLSECIHYNRKLNITFNFRFHTYENFFLKCDVTGHACHKLSNLLGPPRPL